MPEEQVKNVVTPNPQPINLPRAGNTDSGDEVKQFLDRYFQSSLSFPSNQVDAVIGFFENRNFDKISAQTIGTVLMQQAKLDDVNVFELLDTLKGLDTLQLSAVVTEVLNYNRSKVSTLGYKITSATDKLETRNVLV
ncbi:MAG: hypothetical protein CMA31_02670 [Euryarchaeota archaeon]|nr:hypothetical protein [Euryarchaeota archaeon]|tara:strand:+ start:1718 stop:2128 length:411 start_codon:yes stop_codon:yes gene_type:complete